MKYELPEHFNDIEHFITGSVRFKADTKYSDLDVCIPIWELENALKPYCTDSIKSSAYSNGKKVYVASERYELNIIPLHPREYVAWYRVAKMIEQYDILAGSSKQTRIAVHETLLAMVKLTLTEGITSSNYEQFLEDIIVPKYKCGATLPCAKGSDYNCYSDRECEYKV